MNRKHILALAATAVFMFPVYGCTPAAKQETGFVGNVNNVPSTINRGPVTTTAGYHARPDIANVLTRSIPGVRSAVVYVKGHTAYVAVNRGVLGGRDGGYTGRTAGTYGDHPSTGGYTRGPGIYGGATTNGTTGGYAPGYPGGTAGGATGPRVGAGGYVPRTAGDGTVGVPSGRPGTYIGGYTGGTATTPGGTIGGNMGTTGGAIGNRVGGTATLPANVHQRIVNSVKASDHDIHTVYVSDDPTLLSRFQGFVGGAVGAARTGVNDIADTIRHFFPGVRP
jgi:hypothetical protein